MFCRVILVFAFCWYSECSYGQLRLPDAFLSASDVTIKPEEILAGRVKRIVEYDLWFRLDSVTKKVVETSRRLPKTIVFDRNGHRVEESYSQPSYSFHVLYLYDAHGRLASKRERTDAGFALTDSVEYNDCTGVVTQTSYANGAMDARHVFRYANNMLVSSSHKTANQFNFETMYRYDAAGRLLQQVNKNLGGSALPMDTRKSTKGFRTWTDDTLVYTYTDSVGFYTTLCTRSTGAAGPFRLLARREHDTVFASVCLYTPDGEKYREQIQQREIDAIRFDTYSFLLGEVSSQLDFQHNTIAYSWGNWKYQVDREYDTKGNWIKATERYQNSDVVHKISERMIEYFEETD